MCGIGGLLGIEPKVAHPAAERMLQALRHRGPDDSGIEIVPDFARRDYPAVLVQSRLAILDPSPAGHQPMSDTSSGGSANWLVFNGEIYNFRELRKDLVAQGWSGHSRTDTEVILDGYRAWGEQVTSRMRGMFAWCLLDGERRQAWFCRDRLGIKPLYLFRPRSGGLLFASELRALLAAGPDLVPPIVNCQALESYLAQGAVFGLNSIVEGVRLLGPGESLTTDWTGREIASRRYWNLSFPQVVASEDDTRDRPEAVDRLSTELREAIRLHLTADVPVGLFLSSGIDSGAIAAVATEVADAEVQTISVGFDQPEFDEAAGAAAVARALGTRHQELRLTGSNVLADLDKVLAAMDQPTVDGFNTFFVARAAREVGLKVALSGLGGDELFGGYASFRDVPRAIRLQRWTRWLGPAAQVLTACGLGRSGAKLAETFTRPPNASQFYFLRRELFLPRERRLLYPSPAGSDFWSGLPLDDLARLAAQAKGLDTLNQISLFELSAYLRHMLLRDSDVFSMAHGLELRVPLLDHVVVDQVTALPGCWKRPGQHRLKPLLLDAVGPRLPAGSARSPKRGFTFPWSSWLRGPLRERIRTLLEQEPIWQHIGIAAEAPAGLWQRFLADDSRVVASQILALAVLADFAGRHRLRIG